MEVFYLYQDHTIKNFRKKASLLILLNLALTYTISQRKILTKALPDLKYLVAKPVALHTALDFGGLFVSTPIILNFLLLIPIVVPSKRTRNLILLNIIWNTFTFLSLVECICRFAVISLSLELPLDVYLKIFCSALFVAVTLVSVTFELILVYDFMKFMN